MIKQIKHGGGAMAELKLYELEDELRKRPRLRERLEELAEGGELEAWEIDPAHDGGKRPLLLMVRVKRGGRESYFLVTGQAGKNGAVYIWEHYPDAYGTRQRGKHPGGRAGGTFPQNWGEGFCSSRSSSTSAGAKKSKNGNRSRGKNPHFGKWGCR